jgi:XTP/dITP diphosphohydrolase/ATP diphosphatase
MGESQQGSPVLGEGASGVVPTEAAREAVGPLAESIRIMARLRGPGGCPWDREQTFDTIKRYTLEETYEVFDAIERRAWPELKDELGDLLLQVLFYAQMADEAGYFTLADVARGLNAKLVRRHPHVFGDVDAKDADAVLRNWEEIKKGEKKTKPASGAKESLLDDVPRSMPSMLEAMKLSSKASKVGFDWQNAWEILMKVEEETAEFDRELKASNMEAAEGELGDMLFSMVNLARFLDIDPEAALRRTNSKFRTRFAAMEKMVSDTNELRTMAIADMETLWERAKAEERPSVESQKRDVGDLHSHVRREAV